MTAISEQALASVKEWPRSVLCFVPPTVCEYGVSALASDRSRDMISNLKPILAYRNDAVVARLEKELGLLPDEAKVLFDDLKRFLWLSTVGERPMAPPPRIDGAWHVFLWFTRDYADFCKRLFGVFLHHRPRRPDDPPQDGTSRRNLANAIISHFGGFESLSINWEMPVVRSDTCSSDGVSCAPSQPCES
jgi:hypothetical protein